MIQHHFISAWRNLVKNKVFSFINITGLAIGLAACTIIFLYVDHEVGYDQYNLNADRIARVTATIHTPESDLVFATSPSPLATVLKKDYPDIEAAIRLEPSPQVMKLNNETIREDAFYTADQGVFRVFSFDFIEGSAGGALQNPDCIVLTKTIAKKYFGLSAAFGKTLMCNGKTLLVTGVVQDRPSNSDIRIDALLSTDFSKVTSWMDDFSVYTFILFNTRPDLKAFAHKLSTIGPKYVQPELNAAGAANYRVQFELEPLSAVHFSKAKLVDTPKGSKPFNYIFSLLAVFILVIALLNYINLSTARSTERAKEVGIRKANGATRFHLVKQFLFESGFFISIAWLLSIALVQFSLPFFNQLLQTDLAINVFPGLLFMGILFIVTLLLAGSYPAFVLSAFKPVNVLKGNWRHITKGITLRKAVIITQFVIAAALVFATTVIYTQAKFIEKKDLGFQQDGLLNLYLPRDSAYIGLVKGFQDALRQRPEVHGMTIGNGMTQDGISMASTIATSNGKKRELMCNYYFIDQDFLPLFQVHLLEGRNLSDSFATDKTTGFLVNEAFVSTMGWKTAVGQQLEGFGRKGKVLGVVRNFYYRSLHNLVEPLVMIYNTSPANTTTVKLNPHDLPVVKALYKKSFPAVPFDYAFIDDMISNQYSQDRVSMSLFNGFTLLAIIISGMGLYGLVSLVAVQRTKEMGIRKVLGASLQQLLALLATDFVKLVCYAMVIALPVSGFFMNRWLTAYAYHVNLAVWMFLLPVFGVLCVATVVISKAIFKAALTNPVNSLRTE